MKSIIRFPLHGTIGSLIILSLLQPFGISELGDKRIPFILGECICVFFSLFIADCLSSLLLARFFPHNDRYRDSSNIGRIALYLAPSFILSAFVIGASLLTFNGWFHFDNLLIGWFDADGFTLMPYFEMVFQVMVIALILFVWAVYDQSNNNLKDELSELRALNKLLEERQEAVATHVEEESVEERLSAVCRIEGNYHNDVLEVDPYNIVYIESMSNYADICYMLDGNMNHKTLRITLKQLREALAEVDCLMSCHRAFIVNLNFVVSISPRVSGGYQLDVFGCEKQIPVSRTYIEEIKLRIKGSQGA